MKLKTNLNFLGWQIAVLGASAGFFTADLYSAFGLDSNYSKLAYYWFGLLCLAIVLTVCHICWRLAAENIRVSDYFRREGSFDTDVCDIEDLEYIIAHSSTNSDNHTNDDETRRLYDLDNESFTVIKDRKGHRRGYFCLIKLTKAGEEAINEGVFSLRKLSSGFVRKDKKDKYLPLYIAGLYGDSSSISNTFLIASINAHVRARKTPRVYARAETDKGLYWLNRYYFKPVDVSKVGLGHFYVRRIRY
ncbi:hypothetical protein [Rhizobium sp. R86522]|uniref:hypothetical protein n=1 Tax=Rhizobium sp. R86522 TaxID=3093861 RepID=UPI00366F2D76